MLRTTILLPKDLQDKAKQLARTEGMSLSEKACH